MRSIRLTLVIHSLDGGGAERQVSMLANHLAGQGHKISLITLDRIDSDRYPLDSRILRIGLGLMKVSRTPLHGILANWKRIREVRRALQETAPDCIFSFTDKMNCVVLSASKRFAVPVVICEMSDPRQQVLGRLWEAMASSRLSALYPLRDTHGVDRALFATDRW